MTHRQRLTILCPVHDEAETIPPFWARIAPVIQRLHTRYDVHLVFLNNASGDATLDRISALTQAFEQVYVITMSRNVGYQASLATGLRTVLSDLYAIIDVDCEDPPELIEVFVRRYEAGCEVVYGERQDRPEPRLIKASRSLFYRILQTVADDDILLDMAEFSLFTRAVRDVIVEENSSFPFIRASIARAGFDREGVPYRRDVRIAGQSHYNVVRMTIFAVAGILSSSTLLLRLPVYVLPFWALALILLCVAWGLTGAPMFAAASVLAVGLYVGSSVAFVGLYVARTYKNGLARPSAHIHHKRSRLPPPLPAGAAA